MDYTKVPRILIYKDRSSLEDFGVYEPQSFNATLFNALMSLDDLKPRYKGALQEILRLFNDAYYFLTQVFLEKNPIEQYSTYCNMAGVLSKEYDYEGGSESREKIVKCMLIVMLQTFGKDLPAPQQRLLSAIVDDVNDSNYNHQDLRGALRQVMGEVDDVVFKITCNFQFNIKHGSIHKQYYTPRDIQELLVSGVSLKECLSAGNILREAVTILCNDKELKLALIDRLLEPEKEGYGILDIKVTESYRCLYELHSELTGENLPEKLPFERAAVIIPPMSPTPPSFFYNQEKDGEEDCNNKLIEKLKQEIIHLKEQLAQLQQQQSVDYSTEIARLQNDLEAFKTKDDKVKMTASQAAIFVQTVCHHLGGLPNDKKKLAPILESCWGYSHLTAEKALGGEARQEVANKTALKFEETSPKLARLIKEFPNEFDKLRKEKLKANNDNKVKKD